MGASQALMGASQALMGVSQALMGVSQAPRSQRQGVKGLRLVLSRTIQALLVERQAQRSSWS